MLCFNRICDVTEFQTLIKAMTRLIAIITKTMMIMRMVVDGGSTTFQITVFLPWTNAHKSHS